MKGIARKYPFAGFKIGPFLAAGMLWGGILSLILAIRDPLAALLTYSINSFRYKLNPDILWIQSRSWSWDLNTMFAIEGIVFILAGLALGAWLQASPNNSSDKP